MTPERPFTSHGVSPLLSLRADLAGRSVRPSDDDAVVVGALLRHAAAFSGTAAATRSLRHAGRIAKRMLTPKELAAGAGFDEPRPLTPFRLLRTFADQTMRAHGNVALANDMLHALSALIPRESLEGGRLLAQQAATSWYMGFNELSAEQYRRLIRLGRKLGERELVARGIHGLALERMSAGNIPEAERLAHRALRVAGKEYPRVAGQSILKIAICHAVRGDFDRALDFAWRGYQLSDGFPWGRLTALSNMAQILLDAGYPETACVAARHLLRCAPPREHVFAITGTYALAAAAIGDQRSVNWCAATLRELAKTPSFVRDVADALLECSIALDQTGRAAKAEKMRAEALDLARRHGYHDIAYMAEHRIRRGAPRSPGRIAPATQVILTEVEALETDDQLLTEVHAG